MQNSPPQQNNLVKCIICYGKGYNIDFKQPCCACNGIGSITPSKKQLIEMMQLDMESRD